MQNGDERLRAQAPGPARQRQAASQPPIGSGLFGAKPDEAARHQLRL